MIRKSFVIAACMVATPAHGGLPDPVRAMIEAAVATGDAGKVATVVEIAKTTNSEQASEIDALYAAFQGTQDALANARKAEERAAIQRAGLFERWKGTGELGGFRSTGNTDTTGLTGGISLDREGIRWRHKLTARADYQRSDGLTSREKYFAAYEPRADLDKDLFVYGLAQFERDRFQGFDARYAMSGGLGATVFDTDTLDLSVKAGPALRVTDATDGTIDARIAGLVGLDFDWRITDRLKLTQTTNAVTETGGAALILLDSRSTTVNLVTGVEAKVSERLSTRFSYAVDYDSNPLAGKIGTDTTSRFGIVYGF